MMGEHVLTLLGDTSNGIVRTAQSVCLAGVWAWFAVDAGTIDEDLVEEGYYFYADNFSDGEMLAEAFRLGYETDSIGDCFAA
jgi:hypothetical protein